MFIEVSTPTYIQIPRYPTTCSEPSTNQPGRSPTSIFFIIKFDLEMCRVGSRRLRLKLISEHETEVAGYGLFGIYLCTCPVGGENVQRPQDSELRHGPCSHRPAQPSTGPRTDQSNTGNSFSSVGMPLLIIYAPFSPIYSYMSYAQSASE